MTKSAKMSKYKYFSYDPDTGIELHKTAEAAREYADTALDYYKSAAAGSEWDENVTGICWGEIKQDVQEKYRRPVASGEVVALGVTEIVDYELREVSP